MTTTHWDSDRIRAWVDSEDWYQTIPVMDGVATKGSVDSLGRLKLIDLPADLSGRSVLDIGCNSGMYCFEAAARGAERVVGIDINERRLDQARTLADIKGMEVRFEHMDLAAARSLGPFDLVFCFAVLTEVPDLLSSLAAVGELTAGTLFLEISVLDGPRARLRLPRPLAALVARALFRQPIAQIRLTKRGWAMVPERRVLQAILGHDFEITDLGQSVRYRLFRLDRKPSREVD